MFKSIITCLRKINILCKLMKNYFSDAVRYLSYSTTIRGEYSLEQLEARLLAHYHVVEKGMSLKKVRLGYGQENIKRLISFLKMYVAMGYPVEKVAYRGAISTVKAYIDFHIARTYPVREIEKLFDELGVVNVDNVGGTKVFRKRNDLKTPLDFKDFVLSRHSARSFSGEPVASTKIYEAIDIARYSPSACNRQSARVYLVHTADMKKKILRMQNGVRGFSDDIDKLLVVTADLSAFEGIEERNQVYIDGGIFAMSLLYALNYEGLAACALNWCTDKMRDKKLREMVRIGESEVIILLIAVGNYPDECYVAKSARKSVEEIFFQT